MSSNHEILDFMVDIQESISDIRNFAGDITFKEFVEDRKTVNAVIRSLEIIGEAAKKIPGEVRHDYPDVPYHLSSGMRPDRKRSEDFELEKP